MKKHTIIGLAIVFVWLHANSFLMAQVWKTNAQSVSIFEKIKFLDANNGYVSSCNRSTQPFVSRPAGIDNHALLLKTTNGGADWSEQRFDSARLVSAFDFLTPNYGFISLEGENSVRWFRKTTNGGQSWSTINASIFNRLVNIKIINEQLIYAINSSRFFKSTDGGSSWNNQAMSNNYDMKFVDANNGYIFTLDTIRKTTDGGQNWQKIPVKPTLLSGVNRFDFYSPTHGCLLMDSGRVLRTTNGGESWASQTLGNNTYLGKISFADPLNGYIVAGRTIANESVTIMFRTSDGGISWQEQLINDVHYPIYDISVVDGSTTYFCGAGITVSKTTNQGASWNPIIGLRSTAVDIFFPSSRTGYSLSRNEPEGTYLSKTTTSGKLWLSKKVREPDEPLLKTIWFTDSLTGYLAGAQGNIIKTTNAGQNWQYQSFELPDTIERLHFLSANNGFAIGGRRGVGLLLRTTNAGQNWLPQSMPITNKKFSAISFVSPSIGFIAGQDGLVLKTTDAGQSWNALSLGFSTTLNGIWFIDANNGFACGVAGSIFKTTDGGTSWARRVLDQNAVFNDIKYLSNKWHALGGKPMAQNAMFFDAIVYTSTNMGVSWQIPSAPRQDYYRSWACTKLYIKSESQAYLLTNRVGFFEHNTLTTSVFKPKTTKPALAFDLYPNPSSDGNFTIHHAYLSKTYITITNAQGKIINQTILDKSEFDMKLPAGLYFVKLENREGSSVRKLVIY